MIQTIIFGTVKQLLMKIHARYEPSFCISLQMIVVTQLFFPQCMAEQKSLLYRHKHKPTTPVYLYVLCKYAYDSCKSMTGQRIAAAAVWPLTAFLYFDSTAVYVH